MITIFLFVSLGELLAFYLQLIPVHSISLGTFAAILQLLIAQIFHKLRYKVFLAEAIFGLSDCDLVLVCFIAAEPRTLIRQLHIRLHSLISPIFYLMTAAAL